MLLGTTNSKAALQANPTTHKSPVEKAGATWITQIRQMETAGQTMGLDETLNGLNATSEENGIDIHMMLPTEYGAVAILSASGYGNPGKLRDETDTQKRTTTGNTTGVYFTGEGWELLAGLSSANDSKYLISETLYVPLINSLRNWHDGKSLDFVGANMGELRTPSCAVAGQYGLFSLSRMFGGEVYGHAWWGSWSNVGDNDGKVGLIWKCDFPSRGVACLVT